MSHSDQFLILAAALLAFSVFISKGASRFGVPSLLVFLGIGVLVGTRHFPDLPPIQHATAQALGTIALIFILFSGGMDTDLRVIRPIIKRGLVLSTLGVLVSALLVAGIAALFLHFSFLEGLLLGAIVSATDVAAVFTVLRSKDLSLKEGIKPILEFESAVNDPMAVFLSVGLLQLFQQAHTSFFGLIPMFAQQMTLGLLLGMGAGKAIQFTMNHLKLEFDGLYPVLSIALVILSYGITGVLGGSGFLAVYIAGIILGNGSLLHKKSLTHFHEGLAWLMQITMFLTMGLLVKPGEIASIGWTGLIISAFLVLVARPLSVYSCLIGSRFTLKERWMISWGGLRGAVPIILATYPLLVGIPKAERIFHLVFFVVFTSVLFQGATMLWMAKTLKVVTPFQRRFRYPIEFNPTSTELKSELVEIAVPENSLKVGRSLLELGLPPGVLVVLIQREDSVFVPRGATQIEARDQLLVLAEPEAIEQVRKLICGNSADQRS
jgi:cell volume regulation protein A